MEILGVRQYMLIAYFRKISLRPEELRDLAMQVSGKM
jgi:hypothetical protein